MIEDYMPMDRRHDEFYERFMEQRIQKLNDSEHNGVDDSLPFPIEPIPTAPVTFPQIRVDNTSSDSGVNSPHVLSPAMPITLDNSRPYLVLSTSQTNSASRPLTLVQHFNKITRKTKTKELKYNRSSPIILTHSQCFVRALSKAINSTFLSFILF